MKKKESKSLAERKALAKFLGLKNKDRRRLDKVIEDLLEQKPATQPRRKKPTRVPIAS